MPVSCLRELVNIDREVFRYGGSRINFGEGGGLVNIVRLFVISTYIVHSCRPTPDWRGQYTVDVACFGRKLI